jgi:starch synthase
MRIQFVASEIFPLAKTGGLADVAAALPHSLVQLGNEVRLVMPAYEEALDKAERPIIRGVMTNVLGLEKVSIISARMPDTGLPIALIDAPELFRDGGGIYVNADGSDRTDNDRRFALLCHAAARLALGETSPDWKPDIVHCNDWHTGLIPYLLRAGGADRPKSLLTVHNMAFQGLFDLDAMESLGLPKNDPELNATVEFYGKLNFLKTGLHYADWISTVSPTYAQEIQTEEYGCGLQDLLRARADHLTGILNGINSEFWGPFENPRLPAAYTARDISGKWQCKRSLQQELGLNEDEDAPLMIFVSRLTHQKMADVVCDALPQILGQESDRQFALLGQGDPELENRFRDLATQFPGRISVRIGYSEDDAHRLHAGGDILIHGSRFEPCGLTQLYAMRFGTLPIVRPVGGLADTIVNASERTVRDGTATGFCFEEPTAQGLIGGIDHAIDVYRQPLIWRRIQYNAMSADFSWERSAQKYLALYNRLVPDIEQADDEADGRRITKVIA